RTRNRSLVCRRYLSSKVFEYDSTVLCQFACGATRNRRSYSTRVYLASSASMIGSVLASRRALCFSAAARLVMFSYRFFVKRFPCLQVARRLRISGVPARPLRGVGHHEHGVPATAVYFCHLPVGDLLPGAPD